MTLRKKHFENIEEDGENVMFLYTLTLSQTTILDSSKLKEFADYNFEFDENGRKLSKRLENRGKRTNCWLRAISPFPSVFSKEL